MQSNGVQVLQEVRAGRLFKDASTLRADSRKGLIRVIEREDGLISFQWKERATVQPDCDPETDIITFPGDAIFIKIPNSSTRSFMLKFVEADRDLFFWMQEPRAEDDAIRAEQLSANINSYSPGEGQEEEAMDTADQAQIAEASCTGATRASAEEQAGVQAAQLAAALRSIGMPAGMEQGESDVAQLLSAMQQRRQQLPGPSLSEVLKPEVLLPILQDPTILQILAEHLPEGQRTQQDLENLVTSAQFRHQLDVFSSALRSGQLDLSHFGLDSQGSSVLDFLIGIQERFSQADKQ
ncbi:hypothetical protein WJX74_000770 [Apatococcus lobatus]|uniref:Regulatory particle non-ATPase 13 n=2 Tax=Apatococcus TaxID=904362 RepID=A0AAW1SNH2_9CHLO